MTLLFTTEEFKTYAEEKPEYAPLFTTYREMRAKAATQKVNCEEGSMSNNKVKDS